MVIGIKYCGGCNSTYDRPAELQKLMRDYPQHTWVYASQGAREADYWLIICGCSCICANTEGLIARKEQLTFQCPEDFVEVRKKL